MTSCQTPPSEIIASQDSTLPAADTPYSDPGRSSTTPSSPPQPSEDPAIAFPQLRAYGKRREEIHAILRCY